MINKENTIYEYLLLINVIASPQPISQHQLIESPLILQKHFQLLYLMILLTLKVIMQVLSNWRNVFMAFILIDIVIGMQKGKTFFI